MRFVMVNTFISRLAVILLSLVFFSTNTEGYASFRDSYQENQSYKHSSLYDFSYVIQEVTETSEEESEINSNRNSVFLHSFTFFQNLPLSFTSEFISVSYSFPITFTFHHNLKNRAPPIST